MKAKDYPAFLARAKKAKEQYYIEAENIDAKVNQVILKETERQYRWRNNPVAQAHTWDFYLDELDWA